MQFNTNFIPTYSVYLRSSAINRKKMLSWYKGEPRRRGRNRAYMMWLAHGWRPRQTIKMAGPKDSFGTGTQTTAACPWLASSPNHQTCQAGLPTLPNGWRPRQTIKHARQGFQPWAACIHCKLSILNCQLLLTFAVLINKSL
jgi:hypothetical protein